MTQHMAQHDRSPAREGGCGEASGLRERIAAARATPRPAGAGRTAASGYGMAMRLAIELVAALGVSVFLGLWLDRELGSAPLFLILLLVMGMAAGFMNVYRVVHGAGGGLPGAPLGGSKSEAGRGD